MSFATRRAEFTQRGGGSSGGGAAGGGGGGRGRGGMICKSDSSACIRPIGCFVSHISAVLCICSGFRGRGSFGGGPSFDVKGGDWPCPNRFGACSYLCMFLRGICHPIIFIAKPSLAALVAT